MRGGGLQLVCGRSSNEAGAQGKKSWGEKWERGHAVAREEGEGRLLERDEEKIVWREGHRENGEKWVIYLGFH